MVSGAFLPNIWLIPLFPLFGALLMLLFGRRLDPQGGHGHGHRAVISVLCPGMVLVAFLFSVGAVLELAGREPAQRTAEVIVFQWLPAIKASWGFLLDPLSSVMILVVTGVGFL